jgi:hypothetical protein
VATIGNVAVGVSANSAGFVRAMRGAKKEARTFGSVVGKLKGTIAALGVGLGGLAVTNSIRKAFTGLDRIGKLSDQLNVSTEALQGFQLGAELTGASVEILAKGIQRMVRNLGDAQMGIGEAQRGLATLGLEAGDLARMRPEQALMEIAEGISQLGTQSEKAATAYAIFGRQGQELLNFLQGGKSALRGYLSEAQKMGRTFSRSDIKRVEDTNDAITRLATTMRVFAEKAAVALSGPLTAAVDQTSKRFQQLGGTLEGLGFGDAGGGPWGAMTDGFLVLGGILATGGIVKSIAVIGSVIKGLGVGIAAFAASATAAVGAVAASIGGLAVAFGQLFRFISDGAEATIGGKLVDWLVGVDEAYEALNSDVQKTTESTKKQAKAVEEVKEAVKSLYETQVMGPSEGLIGDAEKMVDQLNSKLQNLAGVNPFEQMKFQLVEMIGLARGELKEALLDAYRAIRDKSGLVETLTTLMSFQEQYRDKVEQGAERIKSLRESMKSWFSSGPGQIAAVRRGSVESLRAERDTRHTSYEMLRRLTEIREAERQQAANNAKLVEINSEIRDKQAQVAEIA